MIERDVLQYLITVPALVSKLGNLNKIYVIQAESTTKMPWLIIEPAGNGSRKKITATTMEETSTVRITVDISPAQMYSGREIIELALRAMENYRGDMMGAKDAVVTCSPIRGWASYTGSIYRWQFEARVKFTEPYQEP